MELKEIFKVIKDNCKLFFLVWLICILLTVVLIFFESQKQKIILPISISRNSVIDETDDYQYDQYYRISADEKFGEFIASNISEGVLIDQLNNKLRNQNIEEIKSIKAQNLAPGFIRAEMVISKNNNKNTEIIVDLFKETLDKKNSLSQAGGVEKNWFKLNYDKFVVKNETNNLLIILAGIVFGFFISLVTVFLVYYWRK